MRADLHVHTRHSDGSYTTRQIMEICRKKHLDAVGIVDHDTTEGWKEAITLGKEYGIHVFPGIEISAFDPGSGRKVHILGYGFPAEPLRVGRIAEALRAARHRNTLRQIRILAELGYPLNVEEVKEEAAGAPVLYKQHVMSVLVKKGLAPAIYSELYTRLFKKGGPCSGDIDYVPVFEALAAVKGDGGTAVLAHPGQLDSYHLVEPLIEAGLDGIEMYHEDHGREDHERIGKIAENHPELLLTGGSDAHGDYGTGEIGEILAPESTAERLKQRIASSHHALTSIS